MKNDAPLSFLKSWEGFLPPHSVLMTRFRDAQAKDSVEQSPSATQSEVEPTTRSYSIAFEAPGMEEPALRDLLLKILSAMGAKEPDVLLTPEPIAPDTVAETFIRFSVPAEGNAPGWKGAVLTTYSLAAMLAKPELKKTVWAQLKNR